MDWATSCPMLVSRSKHSDSKHLVHHEVLEHLYSLTADQLPPSRSPSRLNTIKLLLSWRGRLQIRRSSWLSWGGPRHASEYSNLAVSADSMQARIDLTVGRCSSAQVSMHVTMPMLRK